MIGEVPVEFDALIERLSEELPDRLQDEPAPEHARRCCSASRRRWRRSSSRIFDFLNQIFEPTRYHANATLRGFYFTSGHAAGHADRPADRRRWRAASAPRRSAAPPIRAWARAIFLHRPDPAR